MVTKCWHIWELAVQTVLRVLRVLKVLRHFCNDLILRDCEMPVSCFSCDMSCIMLHAICLVSCFMRYVLYHASCDMSCIMLHAICLVSCFMRYVLYHASCDMSCIMLHAICLVSCFMRYACFMLFMRKACSMRGLGYGAYIEVSAPRRAHQVKYSLGGSINWYWPSYYLLRSDRSMLVSFIFLSSNHVGPTT